MTTRDDAPASSRRAALGDDERRALLRSALGLLDANWAGSSTLPSRTLYPHQWSWDTAFIAIGRSWGDQQRAQIELEHLFAAQWTNGMVPHIVFNPGVPADAYFPGPQCWDADRADGHPGVHATSGITQPPLHACAALDIYRHAADRDAAAAFLARLYPGLAAQHAYLARHRDPAGLGLAVIVHPWESGMDNAPIWDDDLDAIDIAPGRLPTYRRRDLVHADPADRPSDAAYDRFVYLAVTYRDAGYDDATIMASSPFVLADPLFNAIWCWAAHALADIARIVGDDPAPHRERARRIHDGMLTHLWDAGAGRFHAYDVRNDRHVPKDTISALMPLLDPDLPDEQVAAIVAELDSAKFRPTDDVFLAASYDLSSADFDARRYWRGPVWINTDWLLWRGLRQHGRPAVTERIAASMLRLVQQSGWREYFDPFTGAGYGSHDFSWSAALIIDLLRRSDQAG
ncbi:MAG TPA: trehalase family glycosidase [Euzebyales bacterium]|nr:trehalase family glycosidase [Euzebyales bacterium]